MKQHIEHKKNKEHKHSKNPNVQEDKPKINKGIIIGVIIGAIVLIAIIFLMFVRNQIAVVENPAGKAATQVIANQQASLGSLGPSLEIPSNGVVRHSLPRFLISEWDFDHLAFIIIGMDYSGNNVTLWPAYQGLSLGANTSNLPQWVNDSATTRNSLFFNDSTTNPYLISSLSIIPNNQYYSFQSMSEFTVSAWVKPTSKQGHRAIIREWGATNPTTFEGAMIFGLGENGQTNDKLLFTVSNNTGGQLGIKTQTEVPLNQWTMVTVSWNGATDTTKIYFNGIEQPYDITSTTPHPQQTTDSNIDMPVTVGAGFQNSTTPQFTFPFRGYIDDVKVFNLALTQKQVYGLMTQDEHVIYEYNNQSNDTYPIILPTDYDTSLLGLSQMSVSAWVTPNSTQGMRTIIRQWLLNNRTFFLVLGNGSRTDASNNQIYFGINGFTGSMQVRTVNPIPINTETSIIATWSNSGNLYPGDSNKVHIYVNGVLQQTVVLSDTMTKGDTIYVAPENPPNQMNTPISIGGNSNGLQLFQGQIRRVKLYDKEIFSEFKPSASETNCTDGLDNDNNGLVDYADPACASKCTKQIVYQIYGDGDEGAAIQNDYGKISAGCCDSTPANPKCYDPNANTPDHCVSPGTIVGDNYCSNTVPPPEYSQYAYLNTVWCKSQEGINPGEQEYVNNGIGYCSDRYNILTIPAPSLVTGKVAGTTDVKMCSDGKRKIRCPISFTCIDGSCAPPNTAWCKGRNKGEAADSIGGETLSYRLNGDPAIHYVYSGCNPDQFGVYNPYCDGIQWAGYAGHQCDPAGTRGGPGMYCVSVKDWLIKGGIKSGVASCMHMVCKEMDFYEDNIAPVPNCPSTPCTPQQYADYQKAVDARNLAVQAAQEKEVNTPGDTCLYANGKLISSMTMKDKCATIHSSQESWCITGDWNGVTIPYGIPGLGPGTGLHQSFENEYGKTLPCVPKHSKIKDYNTDCLFRGSCDGFASRADCKDTG